MLIVEGPDGAGKSSLSEKLAAVTGWQIAPKAVGGDTRSLTDVQQYVDHALDRGFHPMIYDRFALYSAPIYSAFQRRTEPQKGFGDFRWLSTAYARMREVAPIVILSLPPFETVWQNCQRDEDNKRLFPDRGRLSSVYYLYFNLAARNPAMLVYDYTKQSDAEFVRWVEHMIQHRYEMGDIA